MKTTPTLRRMLLISFAAVLTACGSLPGSRVMTFSEADIVRLLEQRGAFQRRLLEVLEVRMDDPTVRLLPHSNRLASELNLTATERVSGKSYRGRIAVDYGLRYDPEEQAIRMTKVRVNKLQIDDLPSPQQAGINRLGTLIAEHVLDDTVLYRFKPSDLRNAAGLGVMPAAVDVTSRGVEVRLAPANR